MTNGTETIIKEKSDAREEFAREFPQATGEIAGAEGQAVTEHRKQWHYLYRTKRWRNLRKRQLTRHPYCACICHHGEQVKANTADHVKPHKGDRKLFFNGKLQSLCAHCHNSCKQSFEKIGYTKGCNETGLPLDPQHLWNQ